MTSTANHIQPRRRIPRGLAGAQADSDMKLCLPQSGTPLHKGATFHVLKSPSSPVDPILNISSLPKRSLTSPQGLADLISESERRVNELIGDFDKNLFISSETDQCIATSRKDVLPVPRAFLAHAAAHTPFLDEEEDKSLRQTRSKKKLGKNFMFASPQEATHHHDSDSGLGSSVSSSDSEEDLADGQARRNSSHRSTTSVYTATKSLAQKKQGHFLDDYATKQIKLHIINPILGEKTLKEYHPLIGEFPRRIAKRNMTCLRDVEKTLIFLAPSKASSPASYLKFCSFAIQCLHTTVDHLNETDQRRPTDRPYTNNYFVDLVEQIRQYARIMAVTRQKHTKEEALNGMDYSPFVSLESAEAHLDHSLTRVRDEKLQLSGGGESGKPLEIVREKDGKTIFIESDLTTRSSDDGSDDSLLDDDVKLSMARKRKCDQGKVEYRSCRECGSVFTRACDLTKHEKTHSRPWKCPEPDCKYHEDGWPTEKERDRHVNDKHAREAPLFKCLYEPCAYSSKRESNCKQHMEKAHGWEYVRAKNKKGTKLVPSPATKLEPTPPSSIAFPSLSTPATTMSNSPDTLYDDNNSTENYGSNFVSPIGAGQSPFDDSTLSGENSIFDSLNSVQNYNNGALLSPYQSDDCPDLFHSPSTGYDHSPANAALPSSFGIDFNFGGTMPNNMDWSQFQNIFPQYFQEPTPAASDLDYNMVDFGNAKQHHAEQFSSAALFTPNETAFPGAQGNVLADGRYVNTAQSAAPTPEDWNLYTEPGPVAGESSAASAAWFPELSMENIGGQFNGQEHVPTTKTTEDFVMDQYLNWDDEADTE